MLGSWSNASYFDGKAQNNMNEEWWGIVGQNPSNNKNGYYERLPKKAYEVLKDLWTRKRQARKPR